MSEFLDAAQATPYVAPRATPPGDLYFNYTKPDGDTFTGPAANVENYLSLGYTVTGELTLSDSESFRNTVSPGTSEPPADGVSAEDPARPAEPETTSAA